MKTNKQNNTEQYNIIGQNIQIPTTSIFILLNIDDIIYIGNIGGINSIISSNYSKNINMQMKNTNSRSAYNTIFDIRNIVDSKEDLNNDDFNKKSCKIMQEITEPDVPDKIIQKKEESKIKDNDEEEKENLITQNEEGENSDEDEGNYIENDFFKTWDYHIDIFRNYKEDKDDYDINLDFSYDEKDKEKIKKDKSKGLNISKNNKSVIIPRKRTLNKTVVSKKYSNIVRFLL